MADQQQKKIPKGGKCLRRCGKGHYKEYRNENRKLNNKARRLARRIRNYKNPIGFLNGVNDDLRVKVIKILGL